MRDPLIPRIEYLVKEWWRQADEIDKDAIDLDEADISKADTLRNCSHTLAEALEFAKELR